MMDIISVIIVNILGNNEVLKITVNLETKTQKAIRNLLKKLSKIYRCQSFLKTEDLIYWKSRDLMYHFINKNMKSCRTVTEMGILQNILNSNPISKAKAPFWCIWLDHCCHLLYQIGSDDARMQLLIYHHCQRHIALILQWGSTTLTFPVADLDFLVSVLFC